MKDGITIALGGFGLVGLAENALLSIAKKGVTGLKILSNTACTADWGLGPLLAKKQVVELNASYVGENAIFEKQYLTGEISLNMIPQGSLAEKARLGGAGIAGAYLKSGVGTVVETGGFPKRVSKDGKSPIEVTLPRERRHFEDRDFILEEAINVDYSLIKAFQADKKGNLRFRKTARNFNPDMAGMGKITIVEAEQIVDEIDPDKIHLPGCFVDRVFKAPKVYKKMERLRFREAPGAAKGKKSKEEDKDTRRVKIAQRAVHELANGMVCNLGIGIPVVVANNTRGIVQVDLHGENGIVGMGEYPLKGEEDCDIINAGKEVITEAIGHSHNSSSSAFGMIRGKHLHMTMLGSMQVSETGDIANWIIPGQKVKGMGGAMDLVSCGSHVVVVMEHVGPKGSAKLVKECSIPLTGKGCVSRLITDFV